MGGGAFFLETKKSLGYCSSDVGLKTGLLLHSVCVQRGGIVLPQGFQEKKSQLLSPTSQSWEFFEAPFPKR